MKKLAGCFIALFLVVSLGYFVWHRLSRHIDLQKLFGGPENLQVIHSPDKVQVWQTIGFLKSSEAHDHDMSDYHKKAGEPIIVSASLVKNFSEKLSNPSSYYSDSGGTKSCIPLPGLVLAFTREDREVDVFLCFECDILMIQVGDTYKAEADFDPSHNDLLHLIKALYPKDERVQALRERKRR
jgi:hypothetical protein